MNSREQNSNNGFQINEIIRSIMTSMKKRLAVISLSLLIVACAPITADNIEPISFEVSGDKAIMTGIIDSDIPDLVATLVEEHPQLTTIVMLHVEGSVDDEANIQAAYLIRHHRLNTHIPDNGLVASGGTDFFLAGVKRTAGSGAQIGVHSWADDNNVEGSDLPDHHPIHRQYLDYYRHMGIPEDFYWFTLDIAPSDDMHWMTQQQRMRYRITTEN